MAMANGQKHIALKHKKQIHIISLFTGDPQIGSSGNIPRDTEGWVNTLNKALEKFPNTSFIQSAGDQVKIQIGGRVCRLVYT